MQPKVVFVFLELVQGVVVLVGEGHPPRLFGCLCFFFFVVDFGFVFENYFLLGFLQVLYLFVQDLVFPFYFHLPFDQGVGEFVAHLFFVDLREIDAGHLLDPLTDVQQFGFILLAVHAVVR